MKRIILSLVSLAVIATSCVKSVTVNPDKSIALNFDTLRLVSGTSKQLLSKNYAPQDLLWKSADTSVAVISSSGLITAKKIGQSLITVSTKSNAISATCTVKVVGSTVPGTISEFSFKGSDIGIGADSSVFIVGIDSVSATGGYSISKLVNNALVKLPECAAVRVAVSPTGVPWVINKSNLIFRYNGTTWDQLPGTGTDIGIGADGSVFVIGTIDVSPTGGFNIMKWNGTNWDTLPQCAGVRIAVSPQGIPWVVNKSNIVYQNGGFLWNPIDGVTGKDIGIGADGTVYVTGNTDGKLYKYTNGAWVPLNGAIGVSVAVSPKGLPWWTDKTNNVLKLN